MVYGLYLTLDQPKWFRGDYSDTDKLTGTVYTDKNKQTAKDLTGFTITLRLYKPRHFGDYFNRTATIVVAANGTWSYAVGSGQMPPDGIYYFKVELSKSGTVESTINTVEFYVIDGATGTA